MNTLHNSNGATHSQKNFWTAYDAEANVLYFNNRRSPLAADDSELTDDDIVIRYKDNQIVGFTIFNVRKHDSDSITD